MADAQPAKKQCKYEVGKDQLYAGDYVSPGMAIVKLDACFPNMMIGSFECVLYQPMVKLNEETANLCHTFSVRPAQQY